jgi:hypothetical protein
MRAILTHLIGLTLLLSSCSGSTNATTPVPSATPTQILNQLTPTPPGVLVIEYHRSGGLQGLDETYWMYSDGRISSTDGEEWTVSPDQVQHLLSQIEQAGFFEVKLSGKIVVPCCDRFSYSLTVSKGDRTKSAQTYDGIEEQAEAIQSAFDAVAGFIQANAMPGGLKPVQ